MSLAWLTTWLNVEESGINGRYYWKDSSLDNRYCNWYYCDRFNWYFLLWFIFRIGLISVVIVLEFVFFLKWKRNNSPGIHSFFDEFEWIPGELLIILIFFYSYKRLLFPMFQKTPFHSFFFLQVNWRNSICLIKFPNPLSFYLFTTYYMQ